MRIGSSTIDWLDRAAVAASLACTVHCLLLPVVLAALPALATVVRVPESFHLYVLAAAAPVASFALLGGCRRHGAGRPLAAGAAGLVVMAAGAMLLDGTPWGTLLTLVGGTMLAGAHLANWRLRHACVGQAGRAPAAC